MASSFIFFVLLAGCTVFHRDPASGDVRSALPDICGIPNDLGVALLPVRDANWSVAPQLGTVLGRHGERLRAVVEVARPSRVPSRVVPPAPTPLESHPLVVSVPRGVAVGAVVIFTPFGSGEETSDFARNVADQAILRGWIAIVVARPGDELLLDQAHVVDVIASIKTTLASMSIPLKGVIGGSLGGANALVVGWALQLPVAVVDPVPPDISSVIAVARHLDLALAAKASRDIFQMRLGELERDKHSFREHLRAEWEPLPVAWPTNWQATGVVFISAHDSTLGLVRPYLEGHGLTLNTLTVPGHVPLVCDAHLPVKLVQAIP